METVQCMNGVILKPIVSKLLSDEENVPSSDVIQMWRTTVERMISLLLLMKVPAHNWLWQLYVRLIPDADLSNVENDSKADTVKRLDDDLSQHLDLCQMHGYLPRDSNEIDSLVITLSRALYDNPEAKSTWLNRVYDTASSIWAKFSGTMKCEVDRYRNVIRKTPGVNWEDTKLLVNSCACRPDRQPLEQMLRFHEPALRVLKTMLLHFVWKHCTVLKMLIDRMGVEDALPKIMAFQNGILQSLKITVTDLNIQDLVLRNVIKILSTHIVDESHNRWFHSQLDDMNGELKDIIKADLLELDAHLYDEDSVFDVPKNIPSVIDDEVDLKSPLFLENTHQFEDYIKKVRETMLPIDFHLLNFFFASKRSLGDTFFMACNAS
ncbi:uncharacterized protein LOC126844720 [Adelges cooleyi]|uniref:uncharacterized protein LOC126844720 n=1 Tax=Adelges cooleyi TaxID=133065 RepID=UPI00217F48D9|nr:uncharacterized protein LOC126844720 [Adelges cooleyi]